MSVRASLVKMEAGVKTAAPPTPATVLMKNRENFPGEETSAM